MFVIDSFNHLLQKYGIFFIYANLFLHLRKIFHSLYIIAHRFHESLEHFRILAPCPKRAVMPMAMEDYRAALFV